MLLVRKSQDRGITKLDWLESKHTFSFGEFHNPDYMGFKRLRVINEDVVEAGNGFPPHPHRDMEIITYIITGTLGHKDNMGNGSLIRAGDVQRMTAGTGVVHSEMNSSGSAPVHLLQIWILPETKNLQPSYEQKTFDSKSKQGKLLLMGSREGREGSLTIHQDTDLYSAFLKKGDVIDFSLRKNRGAWIQLVAGELEVNGKKLFEGDGVAILDEERLTLKCIQPSEFLFFDMA